MTFDGFAYTPNPRLTWRDRIRYRVVARGLLELDDWATDEWALVFSPPPVLDSGDVLRSGADTYIVLRPRW